MTDPIADMFTRIRNAAAVKKTEVVLPLSKIKLELAKILAREGWIKEAVLVPGGLNGAKNNFNELKLVLKYHKNGRSHISSIKRISKPGLRIYVDKDNIPNVLNNLGIAIISTSSGIMTNREARRAKIGGEVIGEIY
ncbi:MAG: 30S ribosomal protein S8 [Candidatus Falkowbacteria bacterium]|nr:30S ribosomal protein S8 [Candidatus Falkowbacteria bacterium]